MTAYPTAIGLFFYSQPGTLFSGRDLTRQLDENQNR